MNLFPMFGASAAGPVMGQSVDSGAPEAPGSGLFASLLSKLQDPAMKAGLLQAGMSMLNANGTQSPFQQIFNGVGEGIMANQRYQDMVTQQEVDRQKLAEEKMQADQKFGLQVALANARMKQIDNAIKTSQANSTSLGTLRAAQTQRALKGPSASGADGSKALSSSWRSFYRMKLQDPSMIGQTPTAEQLAAWKKEFQAMEAAGPQTASSASAAASPDLPAGVTLEDAQALADSEGIDLQTAIQFLNETN